MFDRVCTDCHKRQLVFPGQVTSVVNGDRGIEVSYTCWCGSAQTWLTGRAATEKNPVAAAA
jgi:hypothetical protein